MNRYDVLIEEIFNILSAQEYGFTLSMYDASGMTTLTPAKATWINIKPDNFMLSLPNSEEMGDNDVELWKDESNEDEEILKDIILRIKKQCNENGVGFTTKLYSRGTQPKHFSSMIERNREEEEIEESYMTPATMIVEGCWSVPFTAEKISRLKDLLSTATTPDEAKDEMYDIYGDDKMFDSLDDAIKYDKIDGDGISNVNEIITDHVKEMVKYYDEQPENFKDSIEPELLDELKSVIGYKTNTMESFESLKAQSLLVEKMIGTPLRSHYKAGPARMTIHHGHKVNEKNVKTGRALNVKKIVIECKGKKYEYPFKHLSGGRAMTRHLSEGGKFKDAIGKKICSLSEELQSMYGFVREYRNNNEVKDLVESATARTVSIKETCKALEGLRNYKKAVKTLNEEKQLDKSDVDKAMIYVQSKFGLQESPKHMTTAIKYLSEGIIRNMDAFKQVLLRHFDGSDKGGLDRLVDAIDNQELTLREPLAKATGGDKVKHYTSDIIDKLEGELAEVGKSILSSILQSGKIGPDEKEVIKLFGKMPVLKDESLVEESISVLESWVDNQMPSTKIDTIMKKKS